MSIISSNAVKVLSENWNQEYVKRPMPSTSSARGRLRVVSSTLPLETAAKQEWNDEELMVEMCLGEEWAMEALYERYHKYAYALAYRIVRDDAIADDIVQEAFVAVWHKAATYRELHGSVRAWLLAIVRNRAIDWVRASMSRNYQCTSLQEGLEQDLPSKEPELWEEVWQQERNTILRQTLAQLPANQRQVIELRYFEGSTDVEIAAQLRVPLGTVKGRMRLGLQKMRLLLCQCGLGESSLAVQ